MESIKFAIGDRVYVIDTHPTYAGNIGTVTLVLKRDAINGQEYRVHFDTSKLAGSSRWIGDNHLRPFIDEVLVPLGVEKAPDKTTKQIYVIGSLRNPLVPEISNEIRGFGYTVFDDWYAAGPEADDKWKEYEKARNRNYQEALKGHAAKNVFEFDKRNLLASDAALLVLPAGKSGHLELGWMAGKEKPTFVLLEDDSDRWDVMYQFATAVITRNQMKETFDAI